MAREFITSIVDIQKIENIVKSFSKFVKNKKKFDLPMTRKRRNDR